MEVNIIILKIFNMSFGHVYSIQFPELFIPTSNVKFMLNDHLWRISGIDISSHREKDQEENSWNCILESDLQAAVLKEGSYTINLL
ncbi:hypothetical protein D3C80_1204250 [compost metagenome]